MNRYLVTLYTTMNRGMMGGDFDNAKLVTVEADYAVFDNQHVTFSRKSRDGGLHDYARYNNVISVVREE